VIEALKSQRLAGAAHGFFTRRGGVSEGVYESLNGGIGSNDNRERVGENRRRMAAHLGVDADRFLIAYQIHSAKALIVNEPFSRDARPRCDALVTKMRGLALGVTGADCGIVLLADTEAQVVAAAHAGWKGALDGILEATLTEMEKLGARRRQIAAVLGPTIGPKSYEVGEEFLARFVGVAKDHARFFSPAPRAGHFLFDLPGFIAGRLVGAGIGQFADLGIDTYADEARCFSYRRSVHRKEADYGRLVAAIALA
jgi:polyphenol oxidase